MTWMIFIRLRNRSRGNLFKAMRMETTMGRHHPCSLFDVVNTRLRRLSLCR